MREPQVVVQTGGHQHVLVRDRNAGERTGVAPRDRRVRRARGVECAVAIERDECVQPRLRTLGTIDERVRQLDARQLARSERLRQLDDRPVDHTHSTTRGTR